MSTLSQRGGERQCDSAEEPISGERNLLFGKGNVGNRPFGHVLQHLPMSRPWLSIAKTSDFSKTRSRPFAAFSECAPPNLPKKPNVWLLSGSTDLRDRHVRDGTGVDLPGRPLMTTDTRPKAHGKYDRHPGRASGGRASNGRASNGRAPNGTAAASPGRHRGRHGVSRVRCGNDRPLVVHGVRRLDDVHGVHAPHRPRDDLRTLSGAEIGALRVARFPLGRRAQERNSLDPAVSPAAEEDSPPRAGPPHRDHRSAHAEGVGLL